MATAMIRWSRLFVNKKFVINFFLLSALFLNCDLSRAAEKPPASPKEFAAAEIAFHYVGQWISPRIIKDFLPYLSDRPLPLVLSVDIAAAAASNRYFGAVEESKAGAAFYEEGGRISYEWKGRLKNGFHVLLVQEAGGGSLVANSLLVLRLFPRQGLDENAKPYSRLVLEVERIVNLGDRAETELKIKGNAIDVKVQCEKTCTPKSFTVQF